MTGRVAVRAAPLVMTLLVVVVGGGCGSPLATSVPSLASPTEPAVPSATPAPSASAATESPALPPSLPPGGAVTIDPALLDHLPATVDGLAVQRVPESDAIARTDPIVVGNADAAVTALVSDPAGEFAHATLVELHQGVFDDALFRSWRDAFDASVCEPAGGVAGRAEATIGGRRTFIGSCQAGVHTYHVWLERSSVLVSVSSVGERGLGEKIVAALTD